MSELGDGEGRWKVVTDVNGFRRNLKGFVVEMGSFQEKLHGVNCGSAWHSGSIMGAFTCRVTSSTGIHSHEVSHQFCLI